MTEIAKHAFQYREYRRTLFLNLHAKDEYGRHRGQVLYGFKLTPAGTSVSIGAGALYTAFGTRFFWDMTETPASVDIASVQLSGSNVFSVANQATRPITVMVYAIINPEDPSQQPEITPTNYSSSITFGARVVATSRETTQAILNIKPVDPVGMEVEQTPAPNFDPIQTYLDRNGAPNRSLGGVDPSVGAVQRLEIPIGFIIIGAPATYPTTGVLPAVLGTGTWADGIVYLPAYNAWEALQDFLGHDVLLGRAGQSAVGVPVAPSPALNQTPTKYQAGTSGDQEVPQNTPRFGTPAPGVATDPWEVAWDSYRPPSFMKDGDQLIWQLRRLDYVLRLWMDRTGDQELVKLIQDDGKQMALADILKTYMGDETHNANELTWSAETNNQPLHSGVVPHDPAREGTAPYADSHRGAISLLATSVWHLLTDVFGVTVDGDRLREDTHWGSSRPAGLDHTQDGPLGTLPLGGTPAANRPSLIGTMTSGYLSNEPIYAALSEIARRASNGGINLLANPSFRWGDNDGPSGTPPWWYVDTPGSWSRSNLIADWVKKVTFTFPNAYQPVAQSMPLSGSAMHDILQEGAMVSASVLMRVLSGTFVIRIRTVDGGYNTLSAVVSQPIGVTGDPPGVLKTYQIQAKLGDLTSVAAIEFSFYTTSAGGSVEVVSTWMGFGPAPELPLGTLDFGYMTREGGLNSAMRGILQMGGYRVANVGNATDAADAVNRVTGDGRYLMLNGGNVPTNDIPMGNHRLTGLANPTAAQDAVTLAYLGSGSGSYTKTEDDARFVHKTGDEMSGGLTFPNNSGIRARQTPASGGADKALIGLSADNRVFVGDPSVGGSDLIIGAPGYNLYVADATWVAKKIWHEQNDGHASGLDADKLDGYERTDVNPNVGFCAQNTARQTKSTSPEVVTFTTERYDAGLNYDAVNSRFVAPFAGLYYFAVSTHLWDYNSSPGAEFALAVNGVPTIPTGIIADTGPLSSSLTAVVHLNTGDYVDVRITQTGGSWWVNGSATFSGFCIRKD
jgi:hypothetical protein